MALAAKSFTSSALSSRARSSAGRTRSTTVCAAGRPTWLPNAPAPAWLDGSLPGDRGFDPLGLGADPQRLKWYVEGEKTNGRWAMMAVVGILGQELLGVDTKWFDAGAKDYGIAPEPLLAIEFLVLGFLETKRYQGFKETGTSGFVNSFPFDPLKMNSRDMQEKEIKNGRLAMIALIGFATQALVSRTQPIEGLLGHISNPTGYNFTYWLTDGLKTVNSYYK